jgi:transcriptional regulator with XRE-family HTH domain
MAGDTPLAPLLKARIAASGRRQNDVAKQAGIHASQLSQVLSGSKRLGRDRLLALGSVLGIPDVEILAAAGLDRSSPIRADLTSPHSGSATVKVVTDPIFVDSAIFMWICSTQPLRKHGVELQFERVDWQSVPAQFGYEDQPVIGFCNRNYEVPPGQPALPREILERVHYWSDLCVYRGYAVLARKEMLKNPNAFAQRPVPGDQITALLKEIAEGPKRGRQHVAPDFEDKRVITIGADTRWRLVASPTFGPALQRLEMLTVPDADIALTSFLRGTGALFVGGLPQRFQAESEGCIPIITAKEDPFLFSINSLVCSHALEDKPILYWLEALWAHTIHRMMDEKGFREQVAQECVDLLKAKGMTRSSLKVEHFHTVFESNEYESFITRSSALTTVVVDTLQDIFARLATTTKGEVQKNLERAMLAARQAFGTEVPADGTPPSKR